MPDAKSDVLALSDYAFERLRTRLEGLTDEEYLWEPAWDCWTIRRNESGKMSWDWGVVFDEPPPVTTIAWRICHIVDCLAAERCAVLLGQEPGPSLLGAGLPATAEAAIETLERANGMWRGYVDAVSDEDLRAKLGPAAGIYAEDTRLGFVLHIVDELIHHAAEVSLLRDLYLAERTRDPFVEACLRADRQVVDEMRQADEGIVERAKSAHPALALRAAATGRWEALRLLVDLGFPIEGVNGRTPLHHAAGDGNLDMMRFLAGLGSDLGAEDPVYNATPLGWAEYFRRTEAADYLRSLATTPARS